MVEGALWRARALTPPSALPAPAPPARPPPLRAHRRLPPPAQDISAILDAVGAQADDAKLGELLKSLEGKDIVDVLAAGRAKMATMPAGGGGGGAAAAPAAAGGGGGGGDAPAAKAPEPEPEEEEEDMGFDLFD